MCFGETKDVHVNFIPFCIWLSEQPAPPLPFGCSPNCNIEGLVSWSSQVSLKPTDSSTELITCSVAQWTMLLRALILIIPSKPPLTHLVK